MVYSALQFLPLSGSTRIKRRPGPTRGQGCSRRRLSGTTGMNMDATVVPRSFISALSSNVLFFFFVGASGKKWGTRSCGKCLTKINTYLSLISNKMSSFNMWLSLIQGLRGAPGVAGPQGPAGHNVSPQTKIFRNLSMHNNGEPNWPLAQFCPPFCKTRSFWKWHRYLKVDIEWEKNGKGRLFFSFTCRVYQDGQERRDHLESL